jgi:hypothetical protein
MKGGNKIQYVASRRQNKQSGAVLLAFLLVFIISGSFFLLKDLNANISKESYRNQKTFHSLNQAKETLIGYAVRYPEQNDTVKGPGWLPCPSDELDESDADYGKARSGCATSTDTNTGLLPWKTLGVNELYDSNGENLWYALSDAYRNTQATSVKVNSETAGQITVDGLDDIVAVVIAPGVALDAYNQDRPSIDPLDYLEGENATTGDNTFSFTPTADSNDIVVTITRRELMQAVEKRVLGDVRNVLKRYYDNYGKYPWLSSFANPRAGDEITGVASTGSDSDTLVDSTKDFTLMGLQAGDLVVNQTDDSRGRVVSVVDATTITIDQLDFGTDNDFDSGDTYIIPRFNGNEDTRQGLLPIHEANEVFKTPFGVDWQISTGGTVTVDTGITSSRHTKELERAIKLSYGTVSDSIAVDDSLGSCSWSAVNTIDCKGRYSDQNFLTGSVTSNLTSVTDTYGYTFHKLADCNKDFREAGVEKGDLVINYSDANVLIVDSTAEAGSVGTNLIDTSLDFVALGVQPRIFLVTNTTDNTEGIIETVSATELAVISLPGEELEFNEGDDYSIKEMRIGIIYDDESETVKCPYEGHPQETDTDIDVLVVASANVATPISFDFDTATNTGDIYRVLLATDRVDGTADAPTNYLNFIVYDNDVTDFAAEGARVGDTVENREFKARGTITAMGVDGNGAWFTYTSLQGGQWPDIFPNERYRIDHSHVNERQYDFELSFSGDSSVPTSSEDGSKRRDVCIGYGTDCLSDTPTATTLSVNVSNPTVKISDFDINQTQVGLVQLTLPAVTTGGLRVSGVQYDLLQSDDEEEDLPLWFVDNNWHHLIYVAYSASGIPGSVAICEDPGGPPACLQLNLADGSSVNTVQSLIIAAGDEINDLTIPLAQDRSSGALTDYFENDNSALDDIFRKDGYQSGYNDQVMILRPETIQTDNP